MSNDTFGELLWDVKVVTNNIKKYDHATASGFRPLASLRYFIQRTHDIFHSIPTTSMQRCVFRTAIHELNTVLIKRCDRSIHDRIDELICKLYKEVK